MTRLAALFLLTTACHAAQRYTVTSQPSGAITFSPVGVADLDGDGDSGDADDFAIFQRERTAPGVAQPPVTSQPEVPPYVPPVIEVPIGMPCTTTVLTTQGLQAAANVALPGDVICAGTGTLKGGADVIGWNYRAVLAINRSGTPDKPIVFRGLGTKIDGTGCTYSIRIGNRTLSGDITPVQNVVVEGFEVEGGGIGIALLRSKGVTVRNCNVHDVGGPNSQLAGIMLVGTCEDSTIDNCRVWHCANGIQGYEDDTPEGPIGAKNCTYKNCFTYANYWSSNVGNASNLEFRFASHWAIINCVTYDGSDAGINGLGNILGRVVGTASLNNYWHGGGANQEGMKFCVRGGGGNLVGNCISAFNGATGFDAADGVGDVLIGNTFYGNYNVGLLTEGRETVVLNNLVVRNNLNKDEAYPNLKAIGISLASDWNWFGLGPLAYANFVPPVPTPPNTTVADLVLPGTFPEHTDHTQEPTVRHPESIWKDTDGNGIVSVNEARSQIWGRFKPATTKPGLSLADIRTRCDGNIPAVKAALDAIIADRAGSTDFQQAQARLRWGLLRQNLNSFDLAGIPDAKVIGAVP